MDRADKDLMTPKEVIAYLRLPSKQSLYALTHEKRIPHYKPAGRLLFKKHEIDQWIEGHRVGISTVVENVRRSVVL